MKLTSVLKPAEVQRDWVLIDAEGKTFGRILTE
ncbi:MAG: 50S ribosomal protein L13, partial [Sulfurovum sp.]|nr:50S ribosomal protein L13 [Sulfurovum sp.]